MEEIDDWYGLRFDSVPIEHTDIHLIDRWGFFSSLSSHTRLINGFQVLNGACQSHLYYHLIGNVS